jgi:hypothetical protein
VPNVFSEVLKTKYVAVSLSKRAIFVDSLKMISGLKWMSHVERKKQHNESRKFSRLNRYFQKGEGRKIYHSDVQRMSRTLLRRKQLISNKGNVIFHANYNITPFAVFNIYQAAGNCSTVDVDTIISSETCISS